MCGIICKICYSCGGATIDSEILQRIKNRGPDSVHSSAIKVNGMDILFCGSVLWMQGSLPTLQPVENDKGVLLYNGDIFDEQWKSEYSDTSLIMDKLTAAGIISNDHLIKELKTFKGPFSIIYYHKQTGILLFTRDKIGRNSLLLNKTDDSLVISSVLGRNYDCIEIPATHIYMLNTVTNRVQLYSWDNDVTLDGELEINDWIKSIKLQQDLPDENRISIDKDLTWDFFDEENIVDYITTTSKESTSPEIFYNLLCNSSLKQNVLQILQRLDSSVKIRIEKQPNKCKDCIQNVTICNHSSVGILFSGGLDCTILALLADKYVDKQQSIDLLNVAFKKDENKSYDVPDRITGQQSLEELKEVCPTRKWIFREINIPKHELVKCQETIIADLVHPRQTILDESLGSALWFASQGGNHYMDSPCRVLLLGSGADELFGGYTRHRNAFKRYGWKGLTKELLLDWKRISFRNLARDNRVICDHGRQPRMPYLDEDFTDFVLRLDPWYRCFPSEHLGPGVGDKLFLRLLAFYLGLKNAAVLPKRALQFGTRIANKKEKGSDISPSFHKCII